MAKSGLDSLMDALRASGANVDEKFGGNQSDKTNNSNNQGADTKASSANPSGNSSNKTGNNESSKQPGAQKLSDIPDAILQLPFFEKIKSWTKKGKIIGLIVLLLVLAVAYWWFHPPINIHSETTWTIIIILIIFPLFLYLWTKMRSFASSSTKKDKINSNTKKVHDASSYSSSKTQGDKSSKKDNKNSMSKDLIAKQNAKQHKKYKKLLMIPLGVCVLGLLGMLVSATFFPGNAEKYANVLQTQELDFQTDIQQVDYSQIPVIDRETAKVLGTKEMGTIPDYVSQFEISNLYSQINFQQKPVRVSCLMYADLFKWLTNRDPGIPAYCVVDMATQDAKIMRVSDVPGLGEGDAIKYSESEPLARNIERYVQLKYPFYMFDEFSFEVDEQGYPWWICPVQERSIGLFGGKTIQRVIMCDAITGECQDIELDEVPQWADRVYPSNLLLEQFNWSGKYKKGWLNSWLGQSGVVKTTPGTTSSSNSDSASSSKSLGYNYIAKDDDVWVYTGVTSATSDSSIVGFILINQRTGESHYYSVAGATEVSAMESAEGQVQQMRYVASFPILINVGNQPTYFIPLKDSASLVKKYAMIDIQRYQNVAIGDTVAECQKSYQTLLTREGIKMDNVSVSYSNDAQGKIASMAQAVIDGNSHFYITLEGDSNIYDFPVPGLIQIVKYKIGDAIHFKYTQADQACQATSFAQ